MQKWLDENCTDEWMIRYDNEDAYKIYFAKETQLYWFMLIWLGD
jgi:hypothetical protein